MKVPHTVNDSRGLAALHALGMMSEEEARDFADHLAGGCPTCRAEVAEMGVVIGEFGLLAGEAEPPQSLRSHILDSVAQESRPADRRDLQIWRSWEATRDASGPVFLTRSDEAQWVNIGIDGVDVRRLYVDPMRRQVTMLIRMAPGTSYPPHRHGGVEECFVLEGDLKVDDVVMHAGDYQRVETGGVHSTQSTEGGCLLYITSSMEDEVLT